MTASDPQRVCAALYREIQDAGRGRRGVILGGSNTGDLFEQPSGSFVYLPELIALAHAEVGRVAIVRNSLGIIQDPAPGLAAIPLRLPAADTAPGRAVREIHDQLLTCPQPVVLVIDYANLALPRGLAAETASTDQQLLIETLARFPIDKNLRAHRVVVIDRADDIDPRLAR